MKSVVSIKFFSGYVVWIFIQKSWKFGSNTCYICLNREFFFIGNCFLLAHLVYNYSVHSRRFCDAESDTEKQESKVIWRRGASRPHSRTPQFVIQSSGFTFHVLSPLAAANALVRRGHWADEQYAMHSSGGAYDGPALVLLTVPLSTGESLPQSTYFNPYHFTRSTPGRSTARYNDFG